VKATAHLRVTSDGTRSMPVDIRSEPPFAIRRSGSRVLLVSSAAAPVGGDDLALEVDVGPGATADLGTVAATMIWPSPVPALSVMTTTIVVAEGGHLVWRPNPMVSVQGSDHLASTVVRLAHDATAVIVEEVALGRHGERSGELELRLRVERDGRPLVHHIERFGPSQPGAGSVVSTAGARHVCQAVLVGVDAGGPRSRVVGACAAAWLPLAPDAVVVLAAGPDRPAVLAMLRELAPELTLTA
jgi:urease accessory protein